jgi:hypothetical protein
VLVAVRQHREETRALDGGVELALENGTGASQASRNNLAVFSDEIAKGIDIFVVNLFDASHCEAAKALALEQQILGWALWALVFVVETFWSGHDGLLKFLRIR